MIRVTESKLVKTVFGKVQDVVACVTQQDKVDKSQQSNRILSDRVAELQEAYKSAQTRAREALEANKKIHASNRDSLNLLEKLSLQYEELEVDLRKEKALCKRYSEDRDYFSASNNNLCIEMQHLRKESNILFALTLFGIGIITPVTILLLKTAYPTWEAFLTAINNLF